jgi:hypothetical protein
MCQRQQRVMHLSYWSSDIVVQREISSHNDMQLLFVAFRWSWAPSLENAINFF